MAFGKKVCLCDIFFVVIKARCPSKSGGADAKHRAFITTQKMSTRHTATHFFVRFLNLFDEKPVLEQVERVESKIEG